MTKFIYCTIRSLNYIRPNPVTLTSETFEDALQFAVENDWIDFARELLTDYSYWQQVANAVASAAAYECSPAMFHLLTNELVPYCYRLIR